MLSFCVLACSSVRLFGGVVNLTQKELNLEKHCRPMEINIPIAKDSNYSSKDEGHQSQEFHVL